MRGAALGVELPAQRELRARLSPLARRRWAMAGAQRTRTASVAASFSNASHLAKSLHPDTSIYEAVQISSGPGRKGADGGRPALGEAAPLTLQSKVRRRQSGLHISFLHWSSILLQMGDEFCARNGGSGVAVGQRRPRGGP